MAFSNCASDSARLTYPKVECRRFRLSHVSIYRKMARRASSRVCQSWVITSSTSSVAKRTLREHDPHTGHHHVVDHRPPAFRSPAIRVGAGHGHRQHAAYALHRALVLVTSDHGAPHRNATRSRSTPREQHASGLGPISWTPDSPSYWGRDGTWDRERRWSSVSGGRTPRR